MSDSSDDGEVIIVQHLNPKYFVFRVVGGQRRDAPCPPRETYKDLSESKLSEQIFARFRGADDYHITVHNKKMSVHNISVYS